MTKKLASYWISNKKLVEAAGVEPETHHHFYNHFYKIVFLFNNLSSTKIKILLPWIAGIITSLPFSRRLSSFLDRLIVISEENKNLLL